MFLLTLKTLYKYPNLSPKSILNLLSYQQIVTTRFEFLTRRINLAAAIGTRTL